MPSVASYSRIAREEKEARLRQRARSIWLTGLSGAGKTTLGLALEHSLFQRGFFIQLLDGDIMRSGINKDLSFSESDRTENIRRIAEINALFNASGIITINCFISPTEAIRQMARTIIGPHHFIEIYIRTPLEVCEARDIKGMYKKARQGLIKHFTGIDSPFEEPQQPELIIDTTTSPVEESLEKMLAVILPAISIVC